MERATATQVTYILEDGENADPEDVGFDFFSPNARVTDLPDDVSITFQGVSE